LPSKIADAFSTPAAAMLDRLGVSPETGLTEAEAVRRRQRYGGNLIRSRQKTSALLLLLHQLRSPVVYLLGAAAALALATGEWEEAGAIVAVLFINTLIGFFTELKATRSLEALHALGIHSVRVRRDGHIRIIPADQLVLGDIVLLEAGDSISADLRLVEASNLTADESTLTGESVPVHKTVRAVSAHARIGERHSMLFKGTTLISGEGTGMVAATGMQTELGQISNLVEHASPGSSPLEKRLGELSKQLVWAVIGLAAVIAAIGMATGEESFLMVEASIALAVAAIPEGLPIVATLALARGMWRMAGQNALVERLSAVETLGATTIILTDKTGTLTENRMAVRRFWLPSGEIEHHAEKRSRKDRNTDLQLDRLLEIARLCNNAALGRKGESDSGDPMEIALLRAARTVLGETALPHQPPRVRQYAFDSKTRMMATVHKVDRQYLFAVKGAPEAVLAACEAVETDNAIAALDEALRRQWRERIELLTHHGLRVLACAMKRRANEYDAPYEGLTLLGLIGLEDPARADVPRAVQACQEAGIRVVMVTGDHAGTARSIGRAVGLNDTAPQLVEGAEVEKLLHQEGQDLSKIGIFARVNPAEKLGLVKYYQSHGEVVAMTGDGVNDAPALRQADIGVAMGLRGTDAAREAAAMVLLDDAFPTIVKAIREGRVIYGNIRSFAAYLLSCNIAEIMVVGIAIVLVLPLPILPLQILYLNLVTDVFPAFALAMGEGEGDVLRKPPRPPKAPILSRGQWLRLSLHSLALTAGTFGAMALSRLVLGLDAEATTTVTFMTLALAQLWHVFNARQPGAGMLRNEITRNPWVWGAVGLCVFLVAVPAYTPLAQVLRLVWPTASMWLVVVAMSLAPTAAIQIGELLLQSRGRAK
jgi:P-type Ca2+ transporter type 2C